MAYRDAVRELRRRGSPGAIVRGAAALAVGLLAYLPIAAAAPLGGVCEASAARFVACPAGFDGGAAACLLVADDEIGDRLFLHALGADGLPAPTARAIPLTTAAGPTQIGDIEALEVADGVVWVVGSHGRRAWSGKRAAGDAKQCRIDGDRLSVFRGSWPPEAALEGIRGVRIETRKKKWRQKLGSKCRTGLFDLALLDLRGRRLAAAACSRFAELEAGASADPDRCAASFRIEGAAVIPDRGGAGRLWLGLRSPTLQGKAVLLRWKEGDELAFDGIALLDLGAGRGVRDLARAGGELRVIAGPAGEAPGGGFEQMAVAIDALESGAVLTARAVAVLPAHAEGLAVAPRGERILVVTDGKAPANEGGRCAIPSEAFDVSPGTTR